MIYIHSYIHIYTFNMSYIECILYILYTFNLYYIYICNVYFIYTCIYSMYKYMHSMKFSH